MKVSKSGRPTFILTTQPFGHGIVMIAPIIRVFKHFFQIQYDIVKEQFLSVKHMVPCPNKECDSVGNFAIHGYYFRYYGYGNQQYRIRVLRIRCKNCNTTHAVLPIAIIAYNPCPMDINCQLIHMKLQENKSFSAISAKFGIDKRSVKRIIKRFVDEHQEAHLRVFGSLHHLISITATDLEKFFLNTNLLYLVSKNKLKRIHYSLVPCPL